MGDFVDLAQMFACAGRHLSPAVVDDASAVLWLPRVAVKVDADDLRRNVSELVLLMVVC